MPQNGEAIFRRLTLDYVLGLVLIACLSACSLAVERRVLRNSEGLSAVINTSGRQRMLSQRIAGLAWQYSSGDEGARVELNRIIPVMASAEKTLSAPYRSDTEARATSHLLHSMYFEGPLPLDTEVSRFLETAQKVTQLRPKALAMRALLATLDEEARAPLLVRLDEVVEIHQRETETRLADLRVIEWVLFGGMVVTLVLEARLIFAPMVGKVVAYSESLIALSNTDQLTGAGNRRGFEERAQTEFARTQRYSRSLSLLLIDVDHFKKVNDIYGHATGDAVLSGLAKCLQRNIRPIDLLGRVGGEEFAVLLPETDLENAAVLAERLRVKVEEMVVTSEGREVKATISIGVATLSARSIGFEAGMKVADRLLYDAKRAGRNRVMWREMADLAGASGAQEMTVVVPSKQGIRAV